VYDHLPKKRARRQIVDIVFDEDAAEAYAELVGKMEVAQAQAESAVRIDDDPNRIVKLRAAYDDLVKQAETEAQRLLDDGAVVRFTFQAIGARAFDDLINEHPPTKEQEATAREKGQAKPNWNPDTFMPELIAASCVSPSMTVDQVQEMLKSTEWNDAELSQLMSGAVLVNMRAGAVDLGKGSGRITPTGRN
jgi:hypothetical protein